MSPFNGEGNIVLTGREGSPSFGQIETLVDVENVVFDDHVLRIVDQAGTAGAYTTISSAVDLSVDGDTVVIKGGFYTETVTVSAAITIMGEGSDEVTIDSTGYGIHITGDIDNGGAATVSISGIEFSGNTVGVRVSSSAVLSSLIVSNSDFDNNSVAGVGSGSGAPGLGAVTITDSTFTDNGTGGSNGTASINLYGFNGDATITNVTVASTAAPETPTASLPDYGIQISGFTPNTYDVTAPMGTVTLTDVTVSGVYEKPLLMIQGYTNLSTFDASGVELNGSSTWGALLFVDPVSSSSSDAMPAYDGKPGFFDGAGGTNTMDFSGITVINTGSSIVDSFVRGTDADDVITGTAGNDFLNALAEGNTDLGGNDSVYGGEGNDILVGGIGDDSLDGGAGTDTAVLTGLRSDYSFVVETAENGRVTGFTEVSQNPTVVSFAIVPLDVPLTSDGTDTLNSIEVLQFGDDSILDTSLAVQVFSSTGDLVGTYATIQAAVTGANAGETVMVAAGTYNEDVVINKQITLLSNDGADTTIINGQNGALGAVTIANGVDGVILGNLGHGFTIQGNNGNGAIENAAVCIQGDHDAITIRGNIIEARGDAGLMNEYGRILTNSVIDSNAFTGKTFLGANPEGFGFSTQFNVGNDVPRQLVVLGNGGGTVGTATVTGLEFTNNVLSGVAGGLNIGGQEQGNNLATIDAASSLIADNDFTGITARYATALRVRRGDTDITGNSFDNSTGGDTRGMYLENQLGTEAMQGNTYTGGGNVDRFAGGSGSESMSGFAGDDILMALGGNDSLDGGDGFDKAVFLGNRADYSVTQEADGSYTVVDNNATGLDEGTDTLVNVEALVFADTPTYAIELDANSPDLGGIFQRYVEDFETGGGAFYVNSGTGFGAVAIASSGDGGIFSTDGGDFAIMTQTGAPGDETGPFTRFDGYRSALDGAFTTSFAVYLDDTKILAGEGFDVSVAANNQSGGHLRDFILHVTHDTSTDKILIGGSNGTNFAPREDLDNQNHAEITTAGWYTFEWKFYENATGALEVAMNVLTAAGDWVFTEVLSTPADDFATVYGGNRYMWFTNIDVAAGIAVDNVQMATFDNNLVQLKDGNTILGSYATIADALVDAVADQVVDLAAGNYFAESPVTVSTDGLTFQGVAGANNVQLFADEASAGLTITLAGEADIEVVGNSASNTIFGNDGANKLHGDAGEFSGSFTPAGESDVIYGGDGNDTIYGGSGADSMFGGSGDDVFYVDDVWDAVIEKAIGGTDQVISSLASHTLAANIEEGVMVGSGSYSLFGNGLANTLVGGNDGGILNGQAGNDTLIGGDGKDSLYGWSGEDLMQGGGGDDTYYVDNVNDEIEDLGSSDKDLVVSNTINLNLNNYVGVEQAQAAGGMNLNFTGDAGDNVLIGNRGSNRLEGGAGRDFMTGGQGADVFVFTSVSDSTGAFNRLDRIVDFEQGTVSTQGDLIDLFGIDAVDGGRNNAFTFIGDADFSGVAGQLRYQIGASGNTNVMADTNGDGNADLRIIILGTFALEDADFIL